MTSEQNPFRSGGEKVPAKAEEMRALSITNPEEHRRRSSAGGKKAQKVLAEIRAEIKEESAATAARKEVADTEAAIARESVYSMSSEGDVLPPDPATIAALEDVLAKLKNKGGNGGRSNA